MISDEYKIPKEELPSKEEHQYNILEQRERIKELAAINQISAILKEGISIENTLQKIVMILPGTWQYPDYTVARIRYDGIEYKTPAFKETKWAQIQPFESIDNKKGYIEIFYLTEFPEIDEGPFLRKERLFLDKLANLIVSHINGIKAREIFSKDRMAMNDQYDQASDLFTGKQLLQKFLNKSNYDRDIYHDLMPFKVKEILLVANLYDAYSIEKEGRFSEYVLGDYYQLNLTSLPRITGVSLPGEVFEQLRNKHFDLIIIMMGVDKKMPIELSEGVKKEFPYIPIFVLLNNNYDICLFDNVTVRYPQIDKVFVWNGDSKIFFAMIKLVEDKINVANDTRIGMVRVIILVEDSIKYYSKYLPFLYNIIMEQTKSIIEDVTTDDLYKILKLRARPKFLLTSTYEEALEVFNLYKEYLLCVISDIEFKKEGKLNKNAGIEFISYIKTIKKELPTILQSSDISYAQKANELQSTFIDKNSETLYHDFRNFINLYLGFGNFIFRDLNGRQIAIAKTLKDFEKQLKVIPDESLIYHGRKNHFSLWLMARGEIQVARIINPAKVSDFESPAELRYYLIEVIHKFRNEQKMGKVLPFKASAITDETNIIALSPGSLGGKGRGCAFINTLIYNFDFSQLIQGINVKTPKTSIIGTEEYESFMDRNKIFDKVNSEEDFDKIKKIFIEGKLSHSLILNLRSFLTHIKKPLAIRSSGLFEDSLIHPFSGIFETYLLPNNHPNIKIRIEHLMNAIKMVYASVFSKTARDYIRAINYKIEEEKMAVIIQEVVGNEYGGLFYPHISGVAQSYNYYPFGHMKPDDGFAVLALGLGKYVVDGEIAYRFCPTYPDVINSTPKDLYKNSQTKFWAIDLKKHDMKLSGGEDAGLIKADIDVLEKHDNLKHCASVFDIDNDRLVTGISHPGPRVVNFSDILKYNYIPLSETLETILDIGKDAIGAPVEIEFAIDLNKDENKQATIYLLQLKPLIGNAQDYNIEPEEIDKDKILLYTDKGMGNGIIDDLCDVIYIDPLSFDKSKTREMAIEIEDFNNEMLRKNRKYILIGPGRWGTRDRWLGIPVTWPQISNAKVIVETSFEDYTVEGSSGSHFFHNITTMNIGYFTIQQEHHNHILNWEVLNQQKIITQTHYFKHVRFKKPLIVRMDGKKRISLIAFQ